MTCYAFSVYGSYAKYFYAIRASTRLEAAKKIYAHMLKNTSEYTCRFVSVSSVEKDLKVITKEIMVDSYIE